VCIRVRPLSDREVLHKDAAVLRVVSITDADGAPLPGKHNVFLYDHIFDEHASTRAMYKRVAQRIVHSALDGINGTIFAYGQTSSGKTYTMRGDASSPASLGVLQLAAERHFRPH
jgi:centromeric protein E